ncbi:hypothetical protein NRB20_11680 [Nocardia sp. RB20]|uniref:Uncharacterized protein n=1 Tax=Nocardia macrotermitis TaxID=2585198 RepID=A0A7K0CX72_9NOCA|nr:hypothetical protein [Nocardia macrotermitis]
MSGRGAGGVGAAGDAAVRAGMVATDLVSVGELL